MACAAIGGGNTVLPKPSNNTPFVALTGSMEVGRQIWETAGRTPPGQGGPK